MRHAGYVYKQSLTAEHNSVFNTGNGFLAMNSQKSFTIRQVTRIISPSETTCTHGVLRGHLVLMDFLLHATLSYQKWLNANNTQDTQNQIPAPWYDRKN